ncbi:hypothetical protein ACLB2K_033237 [Fragaria x ananassa]
MKKEALKDCKIVFSNVIPLNDNVEAHPMWKKAEELDATCSTETDASVTHVISRNHCTTKSKRRNLNQVEIRAF